MPEKEVASSKIISNFEINQAKNKVIIFINPKIFPVSLVSKTASSFKESNWVTIDGDAEDEILVELRPKKEQDLEFIAREFNNKLLEESTKGIKIKEENPALVTKIKEVLHQFVIEEKGRISKQSIVTIGVLLAGVGLASVSLEDVSASHLCGGGGEGGEGNAAPGCFLGNQLVLTTEGEKEIMNIQHGSKVISYDEKTDMFTTSIVGTIIIHDGKQNSLNSFIKDHLISLSVKINDKIKVTKVTENHPYFNPKIRKYRQLRAFELGSAIKTRDGEGIIIEKKVLIDENSPLEDHKEIVYNLRMSEGPNNYLVNGAVVHNDGDDGGDGGSK